jgi:hypothetical protein
MESSTRGGVQNSAQVLFNRGCLRYREERGEWMSREAVPGGWRGPHYAHAPGDPAGAHVCMWVGG